MAPIALHALATAELLRVWEHGRCLASADRALALLRSSTAAGDGIEQLSVGERDQLLFTLREWTFGPVLQCRANCPKCGDDLELEFRGSELAHRVHLPMTKELTYTGEGYEVRYRLPTGADVAALSPGEDLLVNRRRLFASCVLAATRCGNSICATELPETVIAAISGRMAEADPKAGLELALRCPGCQHNWAVVFDIASFFWTELEAWAVRTFREIHVLASAYGWTEPEILALSPFRRQIYLEMIGA